MPLVNGRWPPSIYLCLCNKRRGDGGRAQWRSRIDFLQLGMSWVASPPSKKTNSRPHNEISEWLVLDFRRIAFAFLFFFCVQYRARTWLESKFGMRLSIEIFIKKNAWATTNNTRKPIKDDNTQTRGVDKSRDFRPRLHFHQKDSCFFFLFSLFL